MACPLPQMTTCMHAAAAQALTELTITVVTGSWGYEQAYELVDASGSTVARGDYYEDDQTYISKVSVPDDGTYTLSCYDSYGDGWGTRSSITIQSESLTTLMTGPSTSYFSEEVVGTFSAVAGQDVPCGAAETKITIDYTTSSYSEETSWELKTHPAGDPLLVGSGYTTETNYKRFQYKLCVSSTAGSKFVLDLHDSYGDGWHGAYIQAFNAADQSLVFGPVSDSFSSQVLGPFLLTPEASTGACTLVATGSGDGYSGTPSSSAGFFDGEYVPYSTSASRTAYMRIALDSSFEDVYLYQSELYTGYWVISTDLYSGVLYGYVYTSEDPEDISYQWMGESVMQTETHPFGTKNCEVFGCTASMLGNGVCNPECNYPDCRKDNSDSNDMGFDGGDCCADTNSAPTSLDTNPLICFDPRFSEKYNTWRFDYNVPECRKGVRAQGDCGSCYAFGASTMLDNVRCKKDPTASDAYAHTSAQWVDSCLVSEFNHGMCNGGVEASVIEGASRYGLPMEECFPYAYGGDSENHFSAQTTAFTCAQVKEVYANKKTDGTCPAAMDKAKKKTPDPVSPSVTMDGYPWYYGYRLTEYTPGPSVAAEIRAKLRDQGSGTMGSTWCDPMSDGAQAKDPRNPFALNTKAKNGNSCNSGHAFAVIGYGEFVQSGRTRHFWVMENSWGPDWGDRGHFYWDADLDWSDTGTDMHFFKTEDKTFTDVEVPTTSASKRHLLSQEAEGSEQKGPKQPEGPKQPYWMLRHKVADKTRRKLINVPAFQAPSSGIRPFLDTAIAEGQVNEEGIAMGISSFYGKLGAGDCKLAETQAVLNTYITELTTFLNDNPAYVKDTFGIEVQIKSLEV
eukprot:gene11823-13958_t